MTKFIKSVARRLAECGDYLDHLDLETGAYQRTAAREISDQPSRNLRAIARSVETERSSYPGSVAHSIAKAHHLEARMRRRRDRAKARAQKELMRDDLFA